MQLSQETVLRFMDVIGPFETFVFRKCCDLIDGCQNRVFVDQYHMTILCAQVSIHQGYMFF